MDSCKSALLVISVQLPYIALRNESVDHRAIQADVDLHLQRDGRVFCAGYRRYSVEMPMPDRTAAGADSDGDLIGSVSRDANIGDCVGRYRPLCKARKREHALQMSVSLFSVDFCRNSDYRGRIVRDHI